MDYTAQSTFTTPGQFKAALLELPESLAELSDALENFLIHHAAARSLGFGVPESAEQDRNSRTVEKLMRVAMSRDNASLRVKRDLANYLYVTCHDFSLISVSILRSRIMPTRLRVGFVDYLVTDFWEDHWICEYWDGGEWRLFDPQMGARSREGFGIGFPIDDLPRVHFKSAAEMWLALRAGEVKPDNCGVSFVEGIQGEWLCACNLMRDAAALNKIELLPWDFWGMGKDIARERTIAAEFYEVLDQLAELIVKIETVGATDKKEMEPLLKQIVWALPNKTVWAYFQDVLTETAI